MAKRYGMAINVKRCFGCHSCVLACKQMNNLPLGTNWIRNIKVGPIGLFPMIKQYYLTLLCQQCQKAPCREACPTEAIFIRKDGIVLINEKNCNGCEICITACPYKAISMDNHINVATKCDFCVNRVAQGLMPGCVQTCMGKALTFGDLNDDKSQVSILIRNKPYSFLLSESRTEPLVYYINLPEFTDRWLSNFFQAVEKVPSA